jgi:hypothetical protein
MYFWDGYIPIPRMTQLICLELFVLTHTDGSSAKNACNFADLYPCVPWILRVLIIA